MSLSSPSRLRSRLSRLGSSTSRSLARFRSKLSIPGTGKDARERFVRIYYALIIGPRFGSVGLRVSVRGVVWVRLSD
jgi:hypothetical protein